MLQQSKVYFIYGLHSDDGVIRYVGKTNNIRHRVQGHIRNAVKRLTYKDNWICSVGGKVDYQILDWTLVKSNIDNLERKWIKRFGNLTNLTEGGDGSLGFKHSEETKAKFRARKDFNLEGLRRPESIAKMAASKRGKKLTDEHKSLLSRIHTGKKKSEAHRQNISKAKIGIHLTDEAKRKVGEASKARWRNPEFRERALKGLRQWQITSQNTRSDS